MKKFLALVLAIIMCFSLVACDSDKAPASEENEKKGGKAEKSEDEVVEVDLSVAVPGELQGIWCDPAMGNILSYYAFKDDMVTTFTVNQGVGAAKVLDGTFSVSVDEGKVKYDFSAGTGYSNFTYEDGVLSLTNANGSAIEKVSPAELLDQLTKEEAAGNNNGVLILAEMIKTYYADSEEAATATTKMEAANSAIEAAGQAALQKMRTSTDKVQGITWYEHQNQPYYADECCYFYPYLGQDDTRTWMRVAACYTDAQTDAGWIFFSRIIFSVDGENTTKTFNYNDILRDNDTEVWEIADFEPTGDDWVLLRKIANSTETIIRFQGSEYHMDHVVTQKEKTAILDVLAAYEYLTR